MHWDAHGQTAAEVIFDRVDAHQDATKQDAVQDPNQVRKLVTVIKLQTITRSGLVLLC